MRIVEKPEVWRWLSFRHSAFGDVERVEIELEWIAQRRELVRVAVEVEGDKLSFD